MHTLYGDGVHDDTPAIQELLDSGISEVSLPSPCVNYSISKTLRIHSNQTLRLPLTATIKLLRDSSCPMLTNAEKDAHDIYVIGGIWDYDNVNQAPNPMKADFSAVVKKSHLNGDPNFTVNYESIGHFGVLMSFSHITRFSIQDLTFKNPVTFCIRLAYVKYFTVENIRFDENFGNPTAENMDGIHIDGGCRFGVIRNVQGTCYDDIVAINADDLYDGPISDIQVDGVFGENSLRGVRLLSTKSPVSRISISNVFGTYYQNAIGLTYFYPKTGVRGKMSEITIKNVYGSNAPRRPEYCKGDNSYYFFQYVWVDGEIDIDTLTIDGLYRDEEIANVESFKVCNGAKIHTLSLMNVRCKNKTGIPHAFLVNEGEIDKLYMYNVDADGDMLLDNRGIINETVIK